jgi:hypothetical protein
MEAIPSEWNLPLRTGSKPAAGNCFVNGSKSLSSRYSLSGWFRGFGAEVLDQAGDCLRSLFGLLINLTETAFINVPLIESHNKTLDLKLLWQAGFSQMLLQGSAVIRH